MKPGCRVQDQLSTNEPTLYIIGRELNIRKLPGRQWETNPQPSEQLRPMTTAYIYIYIYTYIYTYIYIYIYIYIYRYIWPCAFSKWMVPDK